MRDTNIIEKYEIVFETRAVKIHRVIPSRKERARERRRGPGGDLSGFLVFLEENRGKVACL